MPEFSALENTLFIPMLGRIYASEHFRNILYDETALSLKDALPKDLADKGSQSQYTLLASASRSANMDPIRPVLPSPQARRRDSRSWGAGWKQPITGTTMDIPAGTPSICRTCWNIARRCCPSRSDRRALPATPFSGDWIRRIRSGAPGRAGIG